MISLSIVTDIAILQKQKFQQFKQQIQNLFHISGCDGVVILEVLKTFYQKNLST